MILRVSTTSSSGVSNNDYFPYNRTSPGITPLEFHNDQAKYFAEVTAHDASGQVLML
ncbi:hypothetical protein SBDP1_1060007 [Syntrophobacter sp. SbD1]|nr:hypothetical protein SBDP1_1060007 [Syntrophobacter sp. SbD1]